MCGICGAVGYVGDIRKKEQILAGMMKAIRHRGPDGKKHYITGDVMLGFQRLSIIDQDTGMQPMLNEDRSIALVFNGEIYNYASLRKELIKRGHDFQSVSDSEVLVHGYEENQSGIIEKLRGMFSFAIWDEKEETFFAARDYFGIKPFYYALIGQTLVFSSEIKSILEFPGYCRSVNEEALEQYLSFQYSVLPETFFKGIYQLLPGHYLVYKNGKLSVVRYFKPDLKPEPCKKWSNLFGNIRDVMYHSVQRHLVSDVEVGSFLSGGVDSGLITAMSGCNQTFTVGFAGEGELYNETSCAKELAEHLGIENNCRFISKEEFQAAVPKVMYHLDEPSGDASAVALYFLAEEASKKVKVVLSGEGADEIFGGYNIYLEPKALKCMNWLPIKIRRKLAKIASDRLPVHMKGRNYLIRAAHTLDQRYIGNAYIFHEDEKKRLLLRSGTIVGTREFLKEEYAGLKHLKDSDQMQSIDLNHWLPGDILQKADKMSMAHSLELRVPYLDRDVFQIASRIPHHIKTKHYTTKYALRKVAGDYLPQEICHRKKLGFPIPIRNWMKEEDWYRKIKILFTSDTAAAYFHTEYLLELLEDHKAGKTDNSRKIWTVLAFLVWHQIFFETEGGRNS